MYELEKEIREESVKLEREIFYRKIAQLENKFKQDMEIQGFRYVKTAERTVTFSFGEIRFSRKCYYKDGKYRYPLDEYLNLKRYERYSDVFLCHVAELAAALPYRMVVKIVERLMGIYITKDTVLKVVKLANKLYENKIDYEYYQEENGGSKKVEKLYIEADGVMVKSKNSKQLRKDIAHVVIHEGTEIEYGKRKKLVNKHEIIAGSSRQAMEDTLLYIEKNYKVDRNTTFVTNSDMGAGYGFKFFSPIVKTFKAKHEHFWDKYHVQKEIIRLSDFIESKLINRLKRSIENHDRNELIVILDTIESTIESDLLLEVFLSFKSRMLHNFKHTNPTQNRSITIDTVGVIESQHCKITNRMKKRKMYWTVLGAVTMAKMIVDNSTGNLESLFLGEWRKEYRKIQEKYYGNIEWWKNEMKDSEIKTVKLYRTQQKGRKIIRF